MNKCSKTPTFTFYGAGGAEAVAVAVVLLDLDVAPHVDEALGGAGRGAGDRADPAPWPPLLAPGAALPAPLLHTQAQVGRQPVRPDPVLHRE